MPVVVIPVYNAPDESIACLDSVLRHTPTDVRVLIIDDHGPDRRFFEHLDESRSSLRHRVDVHRPRSNGGFLGSCNLAFELTNPEDVILVNSDVIVGPQWYERIVAAAQSSSDIATVSVFTNNGTILSLPHRNSPCPDIVGGWSVDEAAERVARVSESTRPVIPTAVGHCFLIKRLAINLVGGFDPAFGTGYGEEVDFSQRCIRVGLRHIVADDVFVFHKGSSSFTAEARPQQIAHEAIVNSRYPWYAGAVQRVCSDTYSPLATAVLRASLVLREHSIAFDGHSLAWKWSGTQQVTIGFIEGMSRLLASRRLAVMVPPSLPDDIKHRLESLGNVDVIIIEDISTDRSLRFDVLVRPYQVNSVEELRWMKRIASRCIVAHLDFISYNNPTYFNSDHDWLTFRELTNLVLAAVDGIAWISEYVKSDANRLGLLTGSVANLVTYNGVELPDSTDSARCPARLETLEGPMISVLGVAFHHKNRLFALRILRELLGTNPDVTLVFAGPTPQPGSSHDEESEFLRSNPHVASRFVDLGAVDVPERNWVLAHSAVVLYPTLSEGFGLIPFEAASAGSPVISSRMGSLTEVIPDDVPSFGNFDPQECATLVSRMIGEGAGRRAPNNSLIARSEQFSWHESCSRMLALIDDVLKRPKNRCEGVWAEAPVPSQLYTPDYAKRLQAEQERAHSYQRWSSSIWGRIIIGTPRSMRRRLVKFAYRLVRG